MTTNNLQIRYCTDDDYPAVFELLKQLWPNEQLNRKALRIVYRKALNTDKQKMIVGTINDMVVGFCKLSIKNHFQQTGILGHIDELIVDKNMRGQKIGKQIMNKITGIARQNGCRIIELDAALRRKEAQPFYESIGFINQACFFSKEI